MAKKQSPKWRIVRQDLGPGVKYFVIVHIACDYVVGLRKHLVCLRCFKRVPKKYIDMYDILRKLN